MLQRVAPTLSKGLLPVALLVSLLVAMVALAPQAQAETTAEDAMVYVGQEGADSYEQSLAGVLYTEDQIGYMADRILWTEAEIGEMADRIVYVTVTSQDGSYDIVYMASDIVLVGMQDGGYLYEVTLRAVMGMPSGWSS